MANIPATVWQPTPQNQVGEYSSSTAEALVDPTDSTIEIIDPTDSTINIIDTGLTFTAIGGTVWVEDFTNE